MANAGWSNGTYNRHAHKWDDPATIEAFREAIEVDGLTPPSAASALGIPKGTFYEWMVARPDFSEAINGFAASLKRKLSKRVMEAGVTQWQADMTILERLWPEEYGRKDRVRHEHTGQVGMKIETKRLDEKSILLAAELEERLSIDEMPRLGPHSAEDDVLDADSTTIDH